MRYIDRVAYDAFPDEFRWLCVSDNAARLYLAGRWRDPFWLDLYQWFGLTNPCGAKLWLGLPGVLAGYPRLPLWRYDPTKSKQENLARPDLPCPERLTLARWAALSSALLAAVFAALTVWLITQRSLSAALFLCLAALHAVPLATVWRVASDWPAQMWTWATVFLLVLSVRTERARGSVLFASCAGITAGWAVGTKFNSALVLVPLAAAILLSRLRWRRRLVTLWLALSVAAVTFLLINPSWQMDPLKNRRLIGRWQTAIAKMFPPESPYHLMPSHRLALPLVGTHPGGIESAAAAAALLGLAVWATRLLRVSGRAFAVLAIHSLAMLAGTALWLPGPLERWLVGPIMAVCALAACFPFLIAARGAPRQAWPLRPPPPR